jgi:hypothetical protein
MSDHGGSETNGECLGKVRLWSVIRTFRGYRRRAAFDPHRTCRKIPPGNLIDAVNSRPLLRTGRSLNNATSHTG